MDLAERRELAGRLLAGYVHGPAAATEATARALARAAAARALVLVEGISDQIAVETLSRPPGPGPRRGGRSGPAGRRCARDDQVPDPVRSGRAGLRLTGLCDLREEQIIRRGLGRAGIGSPRTRAEMELLGFYVCVEDLEDELIRAIGDGRVEPLLDSQGDLGSFRTLQRQPEWRGQPVHAQLRRFLSSGSTRKLRYARLLAGAVDLARLPPPLSSLLATH